MTFFYNLNKTLDAIREKPELKHGQLNERDMGKHNNATTGFKAVAAKAAKEYGSKAAGERVAGAVKAKMAKAGKLEEADLDEGFVDTMKQGAQAALGAIGSTMGHGSDEDMIRDLQKKAGVPVTGKVPPQQPGQQPQGQLPAPGQQTMEEEGGIPMTPKQKSFAAIAPPKDKITFADKIAGAKKEVDEMLGDVAAEAMKNALRGKQTVADEGNAFTGKLKATPKGGKFKMGNKEYTDHSDVDEGFPTVAGARDEMRKRKVGDVTHGAKHDTEETPTGRKVTRRTDPNTGYSVGSDTDDEGNTKSTEKRGRGRPKSTDKKPERVTAKATKHKGGRKEKVEEGPDEGNDMVKLAKVISSCTTQAQLDTARRMAQNFLKKHQTGDLAFYGSDMKRGQAVAKDIANKRDEIGGVEEEAVSKSQRRAAGIAHAAQKGEIPKSKLKGASKEMAKMPKGELNKFASTKEKGLPNKKEKTEESGTVAGSVAPSAGGKAKGVVGKGIYDSVNRELEAMISESMNVSVNMSTDEHGEPRKSITVSAEGEAAEQLAELLNLAGMQAQSIGSDEGCGCETSPCSCGTGAELDENQPDWPTDQETTGEDDPLMRRWAGGLNGPKSTGQSVGAPFNRQDSRQGVMGENKDLGMKLYAELKSFKG